MQIADEIFDLDGEVHATLLGQHPCAVTEILLAVFGGSLVIAQASLLIFADLKDGFATMLQITNAGGQLLLVGKGGGHSHSWKHQLRRPPVPSQAGTSCDASKHLSLNHLQKSSQIHLMVNGQFSQQHIQ